jgi:hypothetical protein
LKWIREIKAVGFMDWFWFVFGLHRDKHHPKLHFQYYRLHGKSEAQFRQDVEKAHRIEHVFSNL